MDKSSETTVQQWEQKLVEDYYNYRWEQLLEPLCATSERWKAGELTIPDMAQALNEVHGQVYELDKLFGQRDDRLVMLIQWLDREWFEAWLEAYSPPKGARLISSLD